jgi:hypothetical protein
VQQKDQVKAFMQNRFTWPLDVGGVIMHVAKPDTRNTPFACPEQVTFSGLDVDRFPTPDIVNNWIASRSPVTMSVTLAGKTQTA